MIITYLKIIIKAVFWWLINNFFLLFNNPEKQGQFYVVKYKCKSCHYQYIAIVPVVVAEEDFLVFCPNCHNFTEHSYYIFTEND